MGEIEIKIDLKTGDINIEGIDYSGNSCVYDIDLLEELLGVYDAERHKKDTQRIQIKGGIQ